MTSEQLGAFMGKIVLRVRQLRLRLSVKRGRDVTIGAAAEGIGLTRVALSRMESSLTEQVSFESLAKIIDFYRRELEEPLTAADLLEYDPNNKRGLEAVAA
jgi:DNA-binding Xre family transcriptional regulator